MAGHRWLKFWPQDWQRDPALRCCGLAARGLWIEMICLMHEGSPYGHLTINGRPVTMKQLGILTGIAEDDATTLVAELENAGVLSRGRGRVIFSRRMVKDREAADAGRKWVERRWKNEGEIAPDGAQDTDKQDNHPNRVATSGANTLESDTLESEESPPIIPPKGEAKSRRRIRKPAGSIPDTWQPSADGVAFAEKHGARSDAEAVEEFRDHYISSGKLMADWDACWRTWCRNARKFGQATAPADLFSPGNRRPASAPDDPWGLNAWIARQPDAKDGVAGAARRPCKMINGWAIDHYAERLADAAGLPPSWRGSWDCLGSWLREGMGMIDEPPILDAVRRQACRMTAPIGSVAVFDATIRGAAARCAGRR